MRVRSASDLVYWTIARAPFVLIAVGSVWALLSGMAGLEAVSFGTEWFVGNDETANVMQPIGGGSDEELLMQALETGDTAQMEAALAQVEQRNAALAEARTGTIFE